MIRILLADDHQLVRDGIKALLEGEDNLQIVAEAPDGQKLMALLKTVDTDIILLDISMPGDSGFAVCRKILSVNPAIRIIFLSMYDNEEFVIQAIRAGAYGYLPKNIPKEELIRTILQVHQGETYISPLISASYISTLVKRARDRHDSPGEVLSRRELEVMKLCAEGLSNKEISDRLYISVRTVESHKTHIMQKLELRNQAEMVRFAIRNNLTEL